ncbi:MAG TPA: hypothetical protein VFY93_01580 [Planctomycetota bacterium]|nr:hypothetical protein [Planctomycetota bacterium]
MKPAVPLPVRCAHDFFRRRREPASRELAEEGLRLVEEAKTAPDPAKAIKEILFEYGALPAVAEKAKEAAD